VVQFASQARGWAGVRREVAADEGSPIEQLTEKLQIDIRETENLRVPFLPWALRIPEPKTKTLDFERFPFQREWYDDDYTYEPEGCVKKATQAGASAWAVRWGLFFPDTKGWTSLYVFPKAKQLNEFSDQRIKPLIERVPYLRSRVPYGYTNNKGLKQVGLGFANFRGSQNKDELDSVDADVIVFDEYDRIVQANIPDAEQRITGSPHGMMRRLGTPTIPQFGISAIYEGTDKRVWMVKCKRCRVGWQEIDFWKNVDQERVLIVCSHCRKPLDVAKGEWVPQVTEVQRPRGYHTPRLIVPWTNLQKIIDHSKEKRIYQVQRFYNKDLGIEFQEEGGRLTDADLDAAISAGGGFEMVNGYSGRNPVTAGIDMASTRSATVRISEHIDENTKRMLWTGEVDDKRLAQFIRLLGDLMMRFKVNMAAIDHLPDGRVARAFQAAFPGRVYVVALTGHQQKQVLTTDEQLQTASVKRTESIDAMISMIRAQNNHLAVNLPENYRNEMKSPQRLTEEDEDTGEVTTEYVSTGPDHFAMAEVFDMIATELWWMRTQVESYFRKQTTTLDEHLQTFERSDLDRPENIEYRGGPEDAPEPPGVEPDEWSPLTDEDDWPRY
jgi:hypothetical protein